MTAAFNSESSWLIWNEGKKVVCFYFSAHFCPPCKTFTPVLADFYAVRVIVSFWRLVWVFFQIFFGILSNHKISEAKIPLVKRGAQNFLFGLRKSALQYSIFSPNRLIINLQICSSFALHQNIFLSRMSNTICPWCDHGRSHLICLIKICQRKTQNIPLNISPSYFLCLICDCNPYHLSSW